jgi:LAO/AO transport system kinase
MTAANRVEIDGVINGDRRAVARAISAVENDARDADEMMRSLFRHTGRAVRLGITGPPGAGKSTLTNKLARHYLTQGHKVGIVAVDPTSPFTGGALLGDRIRMTDVELDAAVFIRSMASRGSLGGLSKKAGEAADVLDAAGYDRIVLETVGVGQSELDIAGAADTTVVVLVPESGDSIQAMKAGLMEIGDLFVMNKADRPGAEQAVMAIKMILGFRPHGEGNNVWMPDVTKTVASEGKGIEELSELIERHWHYLQSSGVLKERRKERMRNRIRELVDTRLRVTFWNDERERELESEIGTVLDRTSTPYDLVTKLLSGIKIET